jgi:hypothetical protein
MKCDELTAYNVVATADVNPDVVDILGCTEWFGYDKDEADKVIAEKDKEIRHHRYKRCMDMVAYCDLKMSYWAIREIHEGDTGKFDLYSMWHERWLELADKFKEAK